MEATTSGWKVTNKPPQKGHSEEPALSFFFKDTSNSC